MTEIDFENAVIVYEASFCPKCFTLMIEPFTALSRADNKTKICPDCGKREGLEALTRRVNND
tara:strand:- start:71 stop:256 length:186 start_codon:yes stop_codon:yes gene_type:complete